MSHLSVKTNSAIFRCEFLDWNFNEGFNFTYFAIIYHKNIKNESQFIQVSKSCLLTQVDAPQRKDFTSVVIYTTTLLHVQYECALLGLCRLNHLRSSKTNSHLFVVG